MPLVNYKVRYQESLFSLAVSLYGSVENSVKLLLENESVIDDINTDIEEKTIVYDSDFKAVNVVPLSVSQKPVISLAKTYQPYENQTIFDITLMLEGNLESIISLVHNSTLPSINSKIDKMDIFNYTKRNTSITNWVISTNQIFQTATPLENNDPREFDRSFNSLEFD